MTSQPASPPHWPMDDRWLDELDALLPVETFASFAPAQAAPHVPAPSTAPVTTPTSSASEDGDEQRIVKSRTPDRRREYRQKKRRELLELRGASSELQAQLYELLQRRQALAVTGDGSKRLIAGWRGVALRQMQRRLAAEALNRELRAQLRTRHEATVSLMETLRAQMATVGSTRAAELTDEKWTKPVMQLTEKDVWDMSLLMHHVDDMCAHASAEIQRVRMPQLEAGKTYASRFSRDVISTSDVRTATFTEMMVVPFPFMDTNLAMEKAYPIMISSECVPAIIEVGEDDSTAAVKYVWGPFEVLSISKAIEVSKRTDLAWRSIIRERGRPAGPCITEYGWGSVVPADELATSTRVQLLTKWRAEQLEAFPGDVVVPNTGSLERYTQMLVESSENDAAELVRTVENVIIDEMVTRKRGSIKVCEG